MLESLRRAPAPLDAWTVSWPRLLGPAAALLVAGLAGALIPGAPVRIPLLVVGAVAGVGLLALGRRVVGLFLGVLAGLLVGYMFLGRGLAYLGVAPLYVGEMVLGLGAFALVVQLGRARWQPLHALIVLFMAMGLAQTIPYLDEYGIVALRDGVTWGYGVFALAVSVALTEAHFATIARGYARIAPVFLVWALVATVALREAGLPGLPGSPVSLFVYKGGDFGVHLAGVAAFILLGLYVAQRVRVPEPLMWLGWLGAWFLVSVLTRGGMLAASAAGAAVLFFRSSARLSKLAFVVASLFVLGLVVNPSIPVGGKTFSFAQLGDNLASVLADTDSGRLEGTKEYRLAWWGTIVHYTFNGEYFWTGKGFGVNLADDDGFQLFADGSLRSPHNGHVEVLARMGVPGLAAWIVLQLAYAAALVSTAIRARAHGLKFWAAILAWLFVYWLAAMLNASFDPYLQGPQGGIWFWSLMGAGIAALTITRRLIDERTSSTTTSVPASDARQ